jgi:putative redox protein
MTASNIRQIRLRWTGEGKRFRGGADGGVEIVVDGDSAEGQGPMQLLLSALAGCMAIDVCMILEKSRVRLDSLEVEAIGVRATEAPRRYESIELVYRLGGPAEGDRARVDRAIELSRDKYCSVLHTLDPALEIDIRVDV